VTAVSVVIPTRGRPELLRRCLDALLAQDFDNAYEVVVVDDGDDPSTGQLIVGLDPSGRCIRRLATSTPRGPAAARNIGWRAASGQIVAFTDDDCIPHRHWLQNGLAAFTDGIAAASGSILVPLPENPTDYERNAHGLQYSEFATANCFYRRDILDEAGGFDERFTAPWREDSDLHFRMIARNARLGRAMGAIVSHPLQDPPFAVSVRQQRKSMFNALLYKKHPELYRRRIQPAPPWQYYTIVLVALAAVGFGLGGRSRSAAVAAGLWTGLTGRFCTVRLKGTSHHPFHVVEMILTSILIPPLAVFWRLRGAIKFRVFFL